MAALAAALATAALAACTTQPQAAQTEGLSPAGLTQVPLTIHSANGAHHFTVEVAVTQQEQATGLMDRPTMHPDRGMIFPYTPAQDVAFWMKNTLIPLDMIFVRPDGVIARIEENAVPLSLEPVPSLEPISAVLEINGGRSAELGIKAGDKVDWPHQARPSGLPFAASRGKGAVDMGLFANAFTWWNGATWGTALFTRLNGSKVGQDEAGNVYFEKPGHPPRRWVIYSGSNDASGVPPGWNAWLRGTIDGLPEEALPPPRKFERKPEPNLTGTFEAFRPDGSLSGNRSRPASTGDYQPWTPD